MQRTDDHARMVRGKLSIHRRMVQIGVLSVVVLTMAAAGVLFNAPPPLLMSIDEFGSVERKRATDHAMTAEDDAPTAHANVREELSVTDMQHDEIRWFDGRPIRPAGTMRMRVTAYSPDERSCGKWADGVTASGYSVWTNGMKLVAADTSILPFGSLVSIPGYDGGNVVPVLDRGGAIKGKRLDVLYPTHERALRWGVKDLEVTIWEYADGEANHFRSRYR